jgi:ankyrin repeat protein
LATSSAGKELIVQPTTQSTRILPANPDFDQLRRQARELLDAFRLGEPGMSAEVRAHYRDAVPDTFALHDAQLVLARAYGFDSWPRLKSHVDGINAKEFISLVGANDLGRAEAMLKMRRDLVSAQWSYGDERRALHLAVMNRSPEMVRLLMRYGADARVGVHPHRDETTAHVMAVERGFHDIAGIIEEEERRRTQTTKAAAAQPAPPGGGTVARKPVLDPQVRAAVARGDIEWLKTRHAEQPIVNVIDWENGGLLTAAAAHNRLEVLTFLLELGLDPDERVRWSEGPDAAYSQGYPLWHCASQGKQSLAEVLLRHGASPNVHVDSSGSPVYAAYSHRQWAMIPLLKQHGGIVTPDIIGLYRETEMAKELLDGAVTLSEGSVPPDRTCEDYLLEYALSGGAAEIVRIVLPRITWPRDDERWFRMLAGGVDFWNHIPWLYAGNKSLDRESYVTAFRLLAARCDPNVAGGFGRRALHEVAAAGAHVTDDEVTVCAEILLQTGARTDVRDDLLKSTPLGWACRWGRVGVVRALLTNGADPVERDAEPWATPRAWAEKKNRVAVLELLREHGA